MGAGLRFERRRALNLKELQALFEASWGSAKQRYGDVLARSFTWVTASDHGELVGFANVAWDGGSHFFLLDVTVHPRLQRKGIGRRLVQEAVEACRGHGEWLHVDAAEGLMTGLYHRCGFKPTTAGLVDLTETSPVI